MGASTIEDADFTNSPRAVRSSLSCLLVMPSSLASSCTRILGTNSPVRVHPRRGDGQLDLLAAHRWVLIGCPSASNPLSLSMGQTPRHHVGRTSSTNVQSWSLPLGSRKDLARRPVSRALWKHPVSGCNQAPRPGILLRTSTTGADWGPTTMRTSSVRLPFLPQPTQVRVAASRGAFVISLRRTV